MWIGLGINLIGLIFFIPAEHSFHSPKWLIFQLAFLSGLFIFGLKVLKEKKLVVGKNPMALFAFLFCAFVLKIAFQPLYLEKSLELITWVGFLLIISLVDFDSPAFEKIILSFEGLAFLIILYGFSQRFHLDPIQWNSEDTRIFSTIGNAAAFGSLVSALMALTLIRFIKKPNPGRWLLFEAEIAALFWSSTRTPFLSVIITGIILFIVLKRDKDLASSARRAVYMLFSGGIAFILLFGLSRHSSNAERFTASYMKNDPDIKGRVYLLKKGMEVLTAHPWTGVGPGGFTQSYLKFRNDEPLFYRNRMASAENTHNAFLEAFVETGIPGGICFLGIWLSGLFILLNGFTKAPLEEKFKRLTIFIPLSVAFLNLQSIYPDVSMEALTAFLLGIIPWVANNKTHAVKLSKFTAFIIFTFAIVTSFPLAVYSIRTTMADVYAGLGDRQMDAKNWKNAQQQFTKAIKLKPWDAALYQKLGESYEYDNELAKSLGFYNMAVSLNPNNPYIWADIGRLAGKNRWRKRALTAYANALALDPFNAFLYHDAAITAERFGAFRLSLFFSREAYQINPDAANTYQYGLALTQTGHVNEGLQLIKRIPTEITKKKS